jgi:hypothetical protein
MRPLNQEVMVYEVADLTRTPCVGSHRASGHLCLCSPELPIVAVCIREARFRDGRTRLSGVGSSLAGVAVPTRSGWPHCVSSRPACPRWSHNCMDVRPVEEHTPLVFQRLGREYPTGCATRLQQADSVVRNGFTSNLDYIACLRCCRNSVSVQKP